MEIFNKARLLSLVGDFTWDFGCYFFIETDEGNFIWSCPNYNGDNSLVATPLTLAEYFPEPTYGRDKGKHVIGEYIMAKGGLHLSKFEEEAECTHVQNCPACQSLLKTTKI